MASGIVIYMFGEPEDGEKGLTGIASLDCNLWIFGAKFEHERHGQDKDEKGTRRLLLLAD